LQRLDGNIEGSYAEYGDDPSSCGSGGSISIRKTKQRDHSGGCTSDNIGSPTTPRRPAVFAAETEVGLQNGAAYRPSQPHQCDDPVMEAQTAKESLLIYELAEVW
jgi:hypothetical protein